MKKYIHFFISGTQCEEIKHKGLTIFCSLRGNERKIIKKNLSMFVQKTLQHEIAKQTDPELVQNGHIIRTKIAYDISESKIRTQL